MGGARWKWLLGLALVALVVAGAYIAGSGSRGDAGAADANDADNAAYDFEASTVLVRQMDAAGRLQYQVQAAHVAQAPREGAVTATDLTMHYDPPRAPADGSQRWTVTAQSAQLPQNSDVIELHGRVRVQGRPEQSTAVATFTTERLDYNLQTQEVSTDAAVEVRSGSNQLVSEKGLQANIKQGTVELKSRVHGQLLP